MNKEKTKIITAPRNITTENDLPKHNEIDSWTFSNSKLQRYIATEALTNLFDGSFYGTFQMKVLDLSHASMTSIPTRVISRSSVQTIILPNLLEIIPKDAFLSTVGMQNYILMIPATCQKIEEESFNAKGKISIVYLGSNDFSEVKMFSSLYTSIKVYVTPYYFSDLFGTKPVFRRWSNSCSTITRFPLITTKFSLFVSITIPFCVDYEFN